MRKCSLFRINHRQLKETFILIMSISFICQACLNNSASSKLYQSSVYTQEGQFTSGIEGPAADRYGNVYAVNFESEGTIGKIAPNGEIKKLITLPSGSIGNGMRFDGNGDLFIADYVNHCIFKLESSTNKLEIFAREPEMSQPNDIAIDDKDRLYASDPDWEEGTGRIWRIESSGFVVLLEDSMGTTNGIEVSPDNKTLYVNESLQRNVWAYDLSPKGEISHKRLLINFPDFEMDGMRCDSLGNLYITRYGKGTVVKLSPKGEVLQEILLKGKNPSNIAFGGKDGCTAFVTVQDRGNIETFRTDTPGREWNASKNIQILKVPKDFPTIAKAIEKTRFRLDNEGDGLIFPIPQSIKRTSNVFTLDESVTINLPFDASDEDISLAHFLTKELSDKYGVALKTNSCTNLSTDKKTIVMGRLDNSLIKQYIEENELEMNARNPGAEGYILHVTNNKIIIAGFDNSGAFYGLQSLRQLIYAGNGKEIGGVEVRDWPNLPFRAIRLYVPGPENIPFFKRFLEDFMALYKFNKVVIEINCMRLDKHPEINAGWVEFGKDLMYSRRNRPVGIRGEGKTSSHYDAGDGAILEKEDVKGIVELANKNFIEVIPEIPSLSHVYYLLSRHPELAEYPGDLWPDTYCPSNSDSYKLLFDVYDEYIDVVKPKMIHIGHDEWRVPIDVCPKCKNKDFPELYVQDVKKIYNFLAAKGIKTAMWGDHLLENVRNAGPREDITPNGVKYQKPGALPPELVRDGIPKDILVFNWFWGDPDNEKDLQRFGFKQVYGNFKPNISNWDERIKNIDLIGGGPSSWAATNEFNFGKDLLYDFLGCANLLWSAHTLSQSELADIVQELIPSIRNRLSIMPIPSQEGNVTEFIDITSYFNLPKNSKVFDLDLQALKTGEVSNQNKKFKLAKVEEISRKCAVATGTIGKGENSFSNYVKGISIHEDVSSLLFLHACALPAGNQKAYYNIPDFFDTSDLIGWYEVVYEDGFTINVPIQYGVNILEWNNERIASFDEREGKTGSPQGIYCYQADPVQCSVNEKDYPINFYAFEWVNPRFGKVILEVNIHGSLHYRSTLPSGNPSTEDMKANAVILLAVSKVKKREVFVPEKP